MRNLNAIYIHGIGNTSSKFYTDANQWLHKALFKQKISLRSQPVHWAQYSEHLQKTFLHDITHAGSSGRMLQKLFISTFSDVPVYLRNEQVQQDVFQKLDQKYSWFDGDDVTIFAHSLGCLIATDWLRARPQINNVKLITLACNIGLIGMGEPFEAVPSLDKPYVWFNVFDSEDMLGYPNVDKNLPYVRNVKANVGNIWRRWNGLSHLEFWNDKKLWTKTIPKIIGEMNVNS